MKIILYTISTCEFSKQEKEYLASHNLPFEEKSVEQNREFLTEMLTVGNNFAGTPLTKIEKDDGKIEILKGFTKSEFDKVLGFEEKAAPVTPVVPVVPAAAAPAPTPPPVAPVVPEPVVPPVKTPQQNDALASVLNDLQAKAAVPQEPPVPTTPPPTVVSGQPTIPDPKF